MGFQALHLQRGVSGHTLDVDDHVRHLHQVLAAGVAGGGAARELLGDQGHHLHADLLGLQSHIHHTGVAPGDGYDDHRIPAVHVFQLQIIAGKALHALLEGAQLGLGEERQVGDQQRVDGDQPTSPVKDLHGKHLGMATAEHVDNPAAGHGGRAILSRLFNVGPLLVELPLQLLLDDAVVLLILHSSFAPLCNLSMIAVFPP